MTAVKFKEYSLWCVYIKGEYTELSNEADPNRRERGLNNWLMDQGW